MMILPSSSRLHYLLASEGFKVRPFNKAEDFWHTQALIVWPVVVTDIWMDGVTGLEVLARLCAISPRLASLLLQPAKIWPRAPPAMAIGPVAFFMNRSTMKIHHRRA